MDQANRQVTPGTPSRPEQATAAFAPIVLPSPTDTTGDRRLTPDRRVGAPDFRLVKKERRVGPKDRRASRSKAN